MLVFAPSTGVGLLRPSLRLAARGVRRRRPAVPFARPQALPYYGQHPGSPPRRRGVRAAATVPGPSPAASAAQARQQAGVSSSSAVKPPSPPPTQDEPRVMRVRAIRETSDQDGLLGSIVTVRGWVRSVRDQKACAFVDVNDGSSLAGLQVVVESESPAFDVARNLTTGCAVTATGTVVESPGKGQRFEIRAERIVLIGPADATYPLQKKGHSFEFLRSIAHLRARTNAIGAVARVRSTLAIATHNFFNDRGFLYLNSPVITASDCEGAGEMFRVTTAIPPDGIIGSIPTKEPLRSAGTEATSQTSKDEDAVAALQSSSSDHSQSHLSEKIVDFDQDFFGKPAFLTVSGQLSAETYACALSNVYTFGPTFRAENSNTSRHLAEFWMIEPEMAFATLEDDMDSAEEYLKHVISVVLDRCTADLEFFDKFVQRGLVDKLRNVVDKPFARVAYSEAIELLVAANKPSKKGVRRFEFPVDWGADLQTEHERFLAEEHFQKPAFVYNYPSTIKAFYMRNNDEDDGRTVQAMDLLVPGIGELIGGSAREERLDVLERKIEANGLDKNDYDWYLDLRRFGSVPHAGYGLGFERLILFVTGMENIREAIPYPRVPGSVQF